MDEEALDSSLSGLLANILANNDLLSRDISLSQTIRDANDIIDERSQYADSVSTASVRSQEDESTDNYVVPIDNTIRPIDDPIRSIDNTIRSIDNTIRPIDNTMRPIDDPIPPIIEPSFRQLRSGKRVALDPIPSEGKRPRRTPNMPVVVPLRQRLLGLKKNKLLNLAEILCLKYGHNNRSNEQIVNDILQLPEEAYVTCSSLTDICMILFNTSKHRSTRAELLATVQTRLPNFSGIRRKAYTNEASWFEYVSHCLEWQTRHLQGMNNEKFSYEFAKYEYKVNQMRNGKQFTIDELNELHKTGSDLQLDYQAFGIDIQSCQEVILQQLNV